MVIAVLSKSPVVLTSHLNLSDVTLGGKMFMNPSLFCPMGPQSISAPSVTADADKICPLGAGTCGFVIHIFSLIKVFQCGKLVRKYTRGLTNKIFDVRNANGICCILTVFQCESFRRIATGFETIQLAVGNNG